ncbi:MAG: phosphoenolpyruvate-protein phosphotransferase [Gammaproteobacteria bacterium]|nr:phosphoenolpyruvate-protein phosphotransferase [Gammaproteobacteria bacterium]
MNALNIEILAIPYFPGVAAGILQIGMQGEVAGKIVLIRQNEVTSLIKHPAAIIVVEAAPFSHTMIGLFGLGVPTVLLTEQQAAMLEEGIELLIDGSSGLISSDLDAVPVAARFTSVLQPGQAVIMADGEAVNLCASVRRASAASNAKDLGARSIGLVRSEFLLPEHGQVPDRTFYHSAFRDICEAAAPLSVTFRLLDVAADKIPPWLPALDAPDQSSGLQGVRLYTIEPVKSVIEAQLEVLDDLSGDYSFRILLPYLTRLEEYDYWLSRVRSYLPALPVGAMAETPVSVLDIRHLLDHADFVAIGCNDLMQGLYAADRDRTELRQYLDPYAPVLFRLLQQVAEQAGSQLDNVKLCGMLPEIQGVLPVLLGLGYRTFSVDAPFIPHLAEVAANVTRAECETLAKQLCAVKTTREALEILRLPTDRPPPFLCSDKWD